MLFLTSDFWTLPFSRCQAISPSPPPPTVSEAGSFPSKRLFMTLWLCSCSRATQSHNAIEAWSTYIIITCCCKFIPAWLSVVYRYREGKAVILSFKSTADKLALKKKKKLNKLLPLPNIKLVAHILSEPCCICTENVIRINNTILHENPKYDWQDFQPAQF